MTDVVKRKCSYYYHKEIGNYHYGNMHPMKPHRVKMADSMIHSYGMYDMMEDMTPPDDFVEELDMTKFHADDYIDFLKEITPENIAKYSDQLLRFNIGEDCPIFDGLYDFCQYYTQGSVIGSTWLNQGKSDIAINWSGGLHHAKKHEASGF
jgi:histone deacetylase 1/2